MHWAWRAAELGGAYRVRFVQGVRKVEVPQALVRSEGKQRGIRQQLDIVCAFPDVTLQILPESQRMRKQHASNAALLFQTEPLPALWQRAPLDGPHWITSGLADNLSTIRVRHFNE